MLRVELMSAMKSYRKENGLNQKEFAVLVGTTQQAISRFECGNINPTIDWVLNVVAKMGYGLELIKGE